MDRITENLLGQFATEYAITNLPPDKQFEHFTAFCMVRRHYSRSFNPADVVIGGGGDTAIDAISIVVNNVLVVDPDTVDELAKQNGFLDVSFIFVQAKRGSSFDGAEIGNFGFGVKDFFASEPVSIRGEGVEKAAEVLKVIFSHAMILRPRPKCFLYFVTTGKWQDDPALISRRDAVANDLESLSTFDDVRLRVLAQMIYTRHIRQPRHPSHASFSLLIERIYLRQKVSCRRFLGLCHSRHFARLSVMIAILRYLAASSTTMYGIGRSTTLSTKA